MDDLISRKALIEWLTSHFDLELDEPLEKEMIRLINDQDAIQPQGIDKDRLIEEIRGWQEDIYDNEYDASKHDYVFERIYEIVNDQPTSDGWIPVSERLPKPYEEVIFCNNIISCYGSIDSDGVWWASDVIPFKQFMKAYNVKAWQPLPQPYKESEEE